MDQVVNDSCGDRRVASHLLQLFGGSAFVLCVVGLHGVLPYFVTHRTRELGVRLALAAQKRQLIWLVMRSSRLNPHVRFCDWPGGFAVTRIM
jgi:hypothetical protein